MPVLKALWIPCLTCASQKPRAVVVINNSQYKHTWPDFPLTHNRLHACLSLDWEAMSRLSVVSARGGSERWCTRASRRKASRKKEKKKKILVKCSFPWKLSMESKQHWLYKPLPCALLSRLSEKLSCLEIFFFPHKCFFPFYCVKLLMIQLELGRHQRDSAEMLWSEKSQKKKKERRHGSSAWILKHFSVKH